MAIIRKTTPSSRIGAWLPAALLSGCILGGELENSTMPSYSQDTGVVQPPADTSKHDRVPPPGPVKALYPRLLAGEKWVFAQYSGTDTGTTAALEVIGESVVGSDSVFIERLTLTVPAYISGQGYLIENLTQTGLLYLRKSDQETVRDTMTTRFTFRDPGDTVAYAYREEEASTTAITGALPDTLKAGAAWILKYAQRIRKQAFIDESLYGSPLDTLYTRTRAYTVKDTGTLAVKAGTFAAFEIDWSDAGSDRSSSGWFAPEAKSMIRQIDGDSVSADTTELASYQLR